MPNDDLVRTQPDEGIEAPEKSSYVDEPEYQAPDGPVEREGYEPPPEYDAGSALSHLNSHADEAARDSAQEKAAWIEAQMRRLPGPGNMPSEEQLLRMTERQRAGFQAAIAKRQQLAAMRANIPTEYQQTRDINRQKSAAVVQIQSSLQSRYPDHWPKVLDEVRALVDTGRIGIDELSNPGTYDVIHKVILGQEAEERMGRQKLRKMAAGASLSSSGGQGNNGPGQQNFGDIPPRLMEQRLRKMGLSESQIYQTLRRNYPGL